jgi:N-acylneuraminate cytidylyltransferase/CMP-N,N'-diacetyllegionaminic acid synthase
MSFQQQQSAPQFIGLVPARAGSQRLPNKHLCPLGGHPLVHYTALAVATSPLKHRTWLYSNDAELNAWASEYAPYLRQPAQPRPQAHSEATTSTWQTVAAFLRGQGAALEATHVVVLQPTSPLRTGRHVEEALALFTQQYAAHPQPQRLALMSITPPPKPLGWLAYPTAEGYLQPQFSQTTLPASACYPNGALYIVPVASLLAPQPFELWEHRVIPYLMPAAASLDVDTAADLALAAHYLEAAREPLPAEKEPCSL